MWHTLLLILHVIVCFELIIVVLLQVGKGSLGGILGGSSQTLFGNQGGNVLTKVTTFSAIIFMVTSILLNLVPAGSSIIKSSPDLMMNKAPITKKINQPIKNTDKTNVKTKKTKVTTKPIQHKTTVSKVTTKKASK